MPEAAQVISFPLDRGTTPFLQEFSGAAAVRLDRIVGRLESMSHLIYLASTAEDLEPGVSGALSAISVMLTDCIAIAELRPLGVDA